MRKVFCLAFIVLLFLVSCSTTEYVYVPVEPDPVDLGPSMQTIFDTRPDNTQMVIKTDITCVFDIIDNSCEYQAAWERWEDYAGRLEAFMVDVKDTLLKRDSE